MANGFDDIDFKSLIAKETNARVRIITGGCLYLLKYSHLIRDLSKAFSKKMRYQISAVIVY